MPGGEGVARKSREDIQKAIGEEVGATKKSRHRKGAVYFLHRNAGENLHSVHRQECLLMYYSNLSRYFCCSYQNCKFKYLYFCEHLHALKDRPSQLTSSGLGNVMAFQRVQFQNFPGVHASEPPRSSCPSALTSMPMACTSACFTYESGILKCYRTPCFI